MRSTPPTIPRLPTHTSTPLKLRLLLLGRRAGCDGPFQSFLHSWPLAVSALSAAHILVRVWRTLLPYDTAGLQAHRKPRCTLRRTAALGTGSAACTQVCPSSAQPQLSRPEKFGLLCCIHQCQGEADRDAFYTQIHGVKYMGCRQGMYGRASKTSRARRGIHAHPDVVSEFGGGTGRRKPRGGRRRRRRRGVPVQFQGKGDGRNSKVHSMVQGGQRGRGEQAGTGKANGYKQRGAVGRQGIPGGAATKKRKANR